MGRPRRGGGPADGGLAIAGVRDGTLAQRLGLLDGDLLVVLGGAPMSTTDDLVTALRVLRSHADPVHAELVRDGVLLAAATPPK